MKFSVSAFVLAFSLCILSAATSLAAPLVGSGYLPFPGATGDPPRDRYLPSGPGSGPWTGTWVGAGPNIAQAPWIGTFSATGPMPQTPPSGPFGGFPGSTYYNFTFTGGYAPGALPIGTYFHFGDLDSGSSESYRLRAFDTSSNLITTPWLETPFASTITAVVGDMPSFSFSPGVYDFNGNTISANPTISVFLKNNTAIGFLELTRNATTTAFTLAAPPIPEPSTMLLLASGLTGCVTMVRRRQRA